MIAERVTKEINARLGFLLDVGLDYLTLSRSAGTLAGGEAQRIRLASQIGSGLVGTLYVLDEPSIGLHQRDNRRLIDTLTRLRDLGNTVIVVEHDEETIRESDWIVDIGPGAGEHGGEVVYSGPVQGDREGQGVDHRPVPVGPQVDPGADRATRAASSSSSPCRARASTTCDDLTVDIPLGCFVADHRRVGVGQVDARPRHPAAGADAADLQVEDAGRHAQADRRHRVPRQGHRHGPVADRAHAAVEPGHLHRRVRQHSQAVRRRPTRPRCAATCPAGSASTSRAGAARRAPATARSRSRCTSCPTCTCRARCARAPATTATRSTSSSRATTSPTCSTCRSPRRSTSSPTSRRSAGTCRR